MLGIIIISAVCSLFVSLLGVAFLVDDKDKEIKGKYDKLETKYLQLSHYHHQLEEDYRKHIYEKH